MASNPPMVPEFEMFDLAGTADVTDAVRKAGMSFAKLIETTGLAVAESSRHLNEVGAASTSALATTLVDVIAVQVNAYDDNGNLTADSRTITSKLPLINFIDPVFYEWSRVRLQGRFQATEFVASTEGTVSVETQTGSSANVGLFMGLLGSGGRTSSRRGFSSGFDVDTVRESSFGNIRASAMLKPKTDIGVPKPRQLIDAPSLGILVGANLPDEVVGETTTVRKAVTIIAFKRDGTANADKVLPLSIDVQGAMWAFDDPDTATETDGEGRVFITLSRILPVKAGESAPDRTPVDVTVTARLGLVSSTTVVSF
jgi:hypothetical protein